MSGQAVEIGAVPVLAVAPDGTGIGTVRTELVIAAVALAATQGAVALWVVRRSSMRPAKRIVIVVGELALGGLVVAIKLLAH